MKLDKNMLVVLAGGFVIAVLVSVLMISVMRPGAPPQPVAQVKTIAVLTATHPIPAGGRLTPGNSAWKNWPESAAFPGMTIRTNTTNPDGIKGRVNRAIGVGEPILQSTIIDDSPNLLAASLKPGMRAVAFKVSAASTAGGFITPGDMVDVIITFAIRSDRNESAVTEQIVQRYISETILENVRVLAIDQQSNRPEQGSKVGRTVTLEVDNKGARQLMLAGQMGELSLALRPIGDENLAAGDEETVTDITTAKIFAEIERLKQNSPITSRRSVRVLSGTGVQNIPASAPSVVAPASISQDDDRVAQSFN